MVVRRYHENIYFPATYSFGFTLIMNQYGGGGWCKMLKTSPVAGFR